MQLLDFRINGTIIWYYFICHRQVWLMAHQLHPDQEDPFLEIGRLLAEESYSREKKEVSIGNLKLDVLKNETGQLMIGEIKKSSRYLKSATMQLAFYLYQLKKRGVIATGKLLIPKERKQISVQLTERLEKELKQAFFSIDNILKQAEPPEARKIRYCSKCAYNQFCWT